MLYTLEGIIFRETKFKESDKIITIFTKEHGKIQAVAKGSRNPRNKLFSITQIFTNSEFVLYKGKSLYSLNQGEIVNSFYKIREDLVKLAYVSYIIELVDMATVYDESNEKLYKLLLKTIKLFTENEIDYEILCRAFEIKYISFLGYKPHIKNCVNCGAELNKEISFSIQYGGTLCKQCKVNDIYASKIDENIKNTLNYLLYNPLDNLKEININKGLNYRLESLIRKYILAHTHTDKIKSLDFLNSVK